MTRGRIALALLGLLILIVPACAQKREETKVDDLTAMAKTFVEQLNKSDFTAAAKPFDAAMQQVMPPEKLRENWQELIGQVGAYKRQTGTRATKAQGYDIVFVTCEFDRAKLDVRVVFDSHKKIAGLFFQPAETAQAYQPPAYVTSGAFDSQPVTVGTGKWALPGTLTLPKGPGPFPALVLVHGSGPQDRDETIGPNKPFRDLAEGLASQGIAVLRYEKRTKAHAAQLASVKGLTVNEETVDDAAAAVALLKKTPSITPHRIFVLGHSLGGMVLHRVVKAAPTVRGLIVMAGSTRPLDEVVLEQTAYIASVSGPLSDADRAKIEDLTKDLAHLKEPDIAKTPERMIMGVPVGYWLDLRAINPPQEARHLSQPMLILQGGKDYQVTEKDFANWKTALSGRKEVEFKFYPNLTHLFMPGEKTPADYQKSSHVEKGVVDDIAGWIKSLH